MNSLSDRITLVDAQGFVVPQTERAYFPEPDPTDAANWPAWTDNWHWCVDPHDVASLEAIEAERLADLHDAPDAAWHRMMAESLAIPAIAGGAPFEPSPQDWEDYARAFADIDASDPPANQISPDELSMLAAGLPVG